MAILMTLFGLLLAIAGGYGSGRQIRLRHQGERVTGTVVRIEMQSIPSTSGDLSGYSYRPVLSFQTLAGQHVETSSGLGTPDPGVQPGQQVRVVYDPSDPSVAQIDSPSTQAGALLLPLICAVVGIGLAVAGTVTMLGS